MPIHITAPSRREFLLGVGVSVFALPSLARGAVRPVDDAMVYIANDTHIGEKQPVDSPVPSHLRQLVTELVEAKRKPACVLINGDLALKDGQPGDYRHLAKLIGPLQAAKIELHLTLGNHDHREVFFDVLREESSPMPPVASRHISVVETKFANFFLLDSLKETMVTQGTIGSVQLHWLAQALDKRKDKPAVIVAHHNPRLGGDPLHFPGGLIDSAALWTVLTKRRQVKAYIHGHIHDRSYAIHQDIHILNTPATSYVADPNTSTTGWTIARLSAEGMTLETRTTDPDHPWNGEIKTLVW